MNMFTHMYTSTANQGIRLAKLCILLFFSFKKPIDAEVT